MVESDINLQLDEMCCMSFIFLPTSGIVELAFDSISAEAFFVIRSLIPLNCCLTKSIL